MSEIVCVSRWRRAVNRKRRTRRKHTKFEYILCEFHSMFWKREETKRKEIIPDLTHISQYWPPCVCAFRFFLFRSLSHPCHRVVVLICACVCVNPSCLTFFFPSPLCLLWFGHFGHCRMDPHILNRTFYSSSPRKKKSDLKMFTIQAEYLNDVQKGKKEARRPTSA